MQSLFLVMMAILLAGCATSAHQTDAILSGNRNLPSSAKVKGLTFIKQKENHCGPASLGMMLSFHQQNFNLQELITQMYTPLKEGTFQTDLMSSARRQSMMVLPVNSLEALLKEIAAGNPVLVFQNLGLRKLPQWHYAVAVGYDLLGPELILHSGPDKFVRTNMRVLEHSWALADYWAILILKPGQLSSTAGELAHVSAASGLEQLQKYEDAAKAYLSILEKWPASLSAHIGMGNIRFAQKKFSEAVIFLTAATIKHPSSAVAWHNLAIAQGAASMFRDANQSSLKAISLVDSREVKTYQESLKEFLQ